MNKRQITIILFIFSSILVFGQKTDEEIEKEAIKVVQNWFENPTTDTTSNLDLSIMSQLQDSGTIVNGLREGEWIIYNIDSSQIGNMIDLNVNNEAIKMRLDPNIEKQIGKYQNDKKEGLWITYESSKYTLPFWWTKKSQTDYKNNLKHGKEVFFQGCGDNLDTLGVMFYENGIETGEGRVFNPNYPYKLQYVYRLTNDKQDYLSEEYYDNGLLEIKYMDTIINNQFYFCFLEYYANGIKKSAGFFNENNNIDSTYREFHPNGQLFIEEEYQNGQLWNVNEIRNINGKSRKIGSFKNGNGLLNVYDENGKRINTIEYIDGIEKNE